MKRVVIKQAVPTGQASNTYKLYVGYEHGDAEYTTTVAYPFPKGDEDALIRAVEVLTVMKAMDCRVAAAQREYLTSVLALDTNRTVSLEVAQRLYDHLGVVILDQ